MSQNTFQDWKQERQAVEQEMDRLITAGMPPSVEARKIRQLQFAALIERRDAADRKFFSTSPHRPRKP
jgi:hypothetical protein